MATRDQHLSQNQSTANRQLRSRNSKLDKNSHHFVVHNNQGLSQSNTPIPKFSTDLVNDLIYDMHSGIGGG